MIVVDTTKAIAELNTAMGRVTRQHIPEAAAHALTDTALGIRAKQILEMRDVFDRPTPWTLSGVEMKAATPRKLESVVKLRDFAGKGIPATKFLAAQIAGGVRRMKRFELALRSRGILPPGHHVVPGPGAKLDAYGNLSAGQIRQILSYLHAAETTLGYRANMSERRRARLHRGSKTKQGFGYFAGRTGRHGPLGIWQRFTQIRGAPVIPIMLFVPETRYEERYDFEDVARINAQRLFHVHFVAALGRSLSHAR